MFGRKNDAVVHDRFEEVSFNLIGNTAHSVMKDKETGVLYYMASSPNGIGLTPLLGIDKTPIVDLKD